MRSPSSAGTCAALLPIVARAALAVQVTTETVSILAAPTLACFDFANQQLLEGGANQ
jgi:hypothetical protein